MEFAALRAGVSSASVLRIQATKVLPRHLCLAYRLQADLLALPMAPLPYGFQYGNQVRGATANIASRSHRRDKAVQQDSGLEVNWLICTAKPINRFRNKE